MFEGGIRTGNDAGGRSKQNKEGQDRQASYTPSLLPRKPPGSGKNEQDSQHRKNTAGIMKVVFDRLAGRKKQKSKVSKNDACFGQKITEWVSVRGRGDANGLLVVVE